MVDIYIPIGDIVGIINEYARHIFLGLTESSEKISLVNIKTKETISTWDVKNDGDDVNYAIFPLHNKIIGVGYYLSIADMYPKTEFVQINCKPNKQFAASSHALYFQTENAKVKLKQKVIEMIDTCDSLINHASEKEKQEYIDKKNKYTSEYEDCLKCISTEILRLDLKTCNLSVFAKTKYVDTVTEYRDLHVSKNDRTVIIKEGQKGRVFIDGQEVYEIQSPNIDEVGDRYINTLLIPYDPATPYIILDAKTGEGICKFSHQTIRGSIFSNIIATHHIDNIDKKCYKITLHNIEDFKELACINFGETKYDTLPWIGVYILYYDDGSIYIVNNDYNMTVIIEDGKRININNTQKFYVVGLL